MEVQGHTNLNPGIQGRWQTPGHLVVLLRVQQSSTLFAIGMLKSPKDIGCLEDPHLFLCVSPTLEQRLPDCFWCHSQAPEPLLPPRFLPVKKDNFCLVQSRLCHLYHINTMPRSTSYHELSLSVSQKVKQSIPSPNYGSA